MERKTIAANLPGFLTYGEFFSRLGGEGFAVSPTADERKRLVDRLSQIGGRPRYLFDGVREDLLATAEVRECRRYGDGRLYVRYEVKAMLADCSWDGPHELLSVWSADGRLESYTFVHGTGRNTNVAATLHLAENEDGVGDEYVEDVSSVLAFARQMRVGDAVVVGNDECCGELMMASKEKDGIRLCWQVFASPWIFNSRSCVGIERAFEAIRLYFDKGILGVQGFCEWEIAEEYDEQSGLAAFYISRELRRNLLRAIRKGDRIAERTLRAVGVTTTGTACEQEVRVPYGPYRKMLSSLRGVLDNTKPRDDYSRLELFLALRGDELAQCDIAFHYENGEGNFAADVDAAEYWYLKAARRGNAMAQSNLGNLYRDSCRCRDALRWLEKAAAQKLPVAMLSLADCLSCPRCLGMDLARAAELERDGNELKRRNYNPDPSRIRV